MRCAGGDSGKEHQVTRLQRLEIDTLARLKLPANVSRHRDTMLCEDVLHESAAIKALWRLAAIAVRRASQG
jgi:hypothetical protein